MVRFVDNFPKVAQLREQGRNLNSQSTCLLLRYHDAHLFGSPHINHGQWGQPFHVPQAIFFFSYINAVRRGRGQVLSIY